MTTEQLLEMGERPFVPQQTLQQLAHFGKFDFIMWNIDKGIFCIPDVDDDDEQIDGYCKGMLMKLNHPKYSDMILITLSYDDTYRIRFMDRECNVTDDIEGIYFDMLFECINNRIVNPKMKFDFNLN